MPNSFDPLADATLNACISIARSASAAICEVYARPFTVDNKSDDTPVTEADRKAHRIIVESLREQFPGVPILSEEGEIESFEIRQSWTGYWLVDPLDGTREFVNRNGEFTVNIAYIESHYPVLGVVYCPLDGICYSGRSARGAALETADKTRQAIRVSQCAMDPVRVLASRSHRGDSLDTWLSQHDPVDLRPCGSSLKFCRLAAGEADVYPRFSPTSEWDTAAGQAVVEAAGGQVLKLDGQRLDYNRKASLLNPDFLAFGPTDRAWLS